MKYFEHLEEDKLLCIKQKVIDDALVVSHEVQQNSGDTQDTEQSSLQPLASKKCNLGTLFKNYEIKIKEQEEQEQVTVTTTVSQEKQHRQLVLKEVEGYLSGDRLDFEEDLLMWWKAQKFVCLVKLHKNIYVYVQQVLHQRDYLVLWETLCHHLGQL